MLKLMNDHSSVVVHEFANVSKEACGQDGDASERRRDVVDIAVGISVGKLSCSYYQLVSQRVSLNPWNFLEALEQRSSCQLDSLLDEGRAGDVELNQHGSTDVVRSGWDELADENIVVDSVACVVLAVIVGIWKG